MSKIFDISLDEIVKTRTSVRTYTDQKVSQEIKDQINSYISNLSSPFLSKVTFKLLETNTADKTVKLGTYGVIKGASNYIGATIEKDELSLEALGYQFEKLVLYLKSLDLGTCWLGGTFKRGEFAKAMAIKEDEIFPIISPFGYSTDKKSFADSLVRFVAKSDQRKAWDNLFFKNDFSTPLTKTDAYSVPLEMVRLAPSASNKQPWRIVKEDNSYHFYEFKTPGYSDSFGYDIQKIDIGIGACHFHLAAIEKNLDGEFKKLQQPIIQIPEHTEYVFSWVSK